MFICRVIGVISFLFFCIVVVNKKFPSYWFVIGYNFVADGVLKGFAVVDTMDGSGTEVSAVVVEYDLGGEKYEGKFVHYKAIFGENDPMDQTPEGTFVKIFQKKKDPDFYLAVGEGDYYRERFNLIEYLYIVSAVFFSVISFYLHGWVYAVFHVIQIIAGVLIILLSLIITYFIFHLRRVDALIHQRQSSVTEGVLAGYEVKNPGGKLNTHRTPVFQFQAGNQTITEECDDFSGITAKYRQQTPKGTKVHICYNPEDPYDFSVIGPEEKDAKAELKDELKSIGFRLLLIAVGVLMIVLR